MIPRKAPPFDSLPAHDQRVILVRFLGEYGTWSFEKREEMLYRIQHKGFQYQMSYQDVCARASAALHYEGRFADKFRILVQWIKSRCLGNMYQNALNESIEEALK